VRVALVYAIGCEEAKCGGIYLVCFTARLRSCMQITKVLVEDYHSSIALPHKLHKF